MPFTIHRGTNISHWLSQSKERGAARRSWFTAADVRFLVDHGFDHLRLPVDEEQMWDESGRPEAEAFGLLEAALDWCAEAGLRAIVDLHILRSHHFNVTPRPLWTEPAAQERFLACWRELSARLRVRPNDLVAYELLNEPVADNAEDWNRVAARAIAALRELETERIILLGSNMCNSPDTFAALSVPDDRNLMLAFHFYKPFLLTHHQASWTPIGKYRGPVHYPGLTITPEDMDAHGDEERPLLEQFNQHFDREVLASYVAKPLAVAKRTGLPLHCGEFGCLRGVPRDDRLRWYRDLLAIFDEHGIAWANWDYRGGFGIRDRERRNDEELLAVLTGK